MGYAVYQNKVYKYRIPRYGSDSMIILDSDLCGEAVPICQCIVYPHICIRVKYQSQWYPFPSTGLSENNHLTLLGPKQDGFCYKYDAGGFPIYAKEIFFPDDIVDAVIQITELKPSGRFEDIFYKLSIHELDWTDSNLIMCILTKICSGEQMEKVPNNYAT